MRNDKELQKAVLAVMLGQKQEKVEEAKKPLHPNQQKLDVHEPEKDKLTAKDFEMLRKGKKSNEEVEQVNEISKKTLGNYVHKAALDMNLKGGDSALAARDNEAGKMKQAVSKAVKRHMGIAKAVSRMSSEETEVELDDEADETVLVHTPIEFEIKESYQFGDYLFAAKKLVGEEKAISLANQMFKAQDTSIFAEEFMRSDIEDKVNAHQKAGHKVSMPKYSTKSGKPYAEYVVTDKETGVRRKYIHHGNMRSVENMGTAGKKDD